MCVLLLSQSFFKVLPYVDGWIRHNPIVVASRAGSNKEKEFELRPILATSTKINQPSRRRMEHGKRTLPCDCREEKEKRNYFSGFDFLVPDLEDEYSSRIMKRNQMDWLLLTRKWSFNTQIVNKMEAGIVIKSFSG